MKKLHSLFILSILALTMFVGCQMPTDGTGNGAEAVDSTPTDTTPTVDADEATYGFTKTVNYTVVANGQSLPGTKTGAELIALAKEKNLVKDTDYTIDGTTVTLTASGAEKFFGNTDNGNTSGDGNTPMTYTLVGEEDNAAKYVLANLPTTDNPSEYAKDDTVTFSIKTKTGETPTELYLVKVTIKKRYIGDVLDIPVDYNKENHTVSFKMPDNDVMVRADFYDVSFKEKDSIKDGNLKVTTNENTKNLKFDVGICFTEDVFDNLKYIDGKYVFLVAKEKSTTKEWSGVEGAYYYACEITTDLDIETGIKFVRCAIANEKVFQPSNKGQIKFDN